MAIIKITANQLPKELRARVEKTPIVLQRGIVTAAHRGRTYMVRKTPRDRGQLRNAWRVRFRRGGKYVGCNLVNDAPYAGVVEHGARPHAVSREGWESIYEWVRRKGLVTEEFLGWEKAGRGGGRVQVRKTRKIKAGGFDDPDISAITWGIVKKLQRVGQAPTYFVKLSLPRLSKLMRLEVARIIKKWSGKRAR